MYSLLNRRSVLKASGALVVTFTLMPRFSVAAPAGAAKPVTVDVVDSYLAIGPDGRITVYSGKVDLGTGVRTALTQIVADELYVPLDHVTVIQGDTLLTPDQGPTYGSLSIQNGGAQLRRAAATARRALLEKAAIKLNTDVSTLSIRDGLVISPSGGKVPFGSLVGGNTLSLKLDASAPLKSPADFKLVGKPVPRLDIPDKVTGRFTFMQDFKRPGMLHGRVIMPAALGATLVSYDESTIRDIPDVVKVVRIENFLGVVARSEWGAIKAARQLSVKWTAWNGLPVQAQIWEHVRSTKILKDDITSNNGDAASAFAAAPRKLAATYNFAIHTHGSIGPSCAVAEFKDGKLTCWTASQSSHNLRKQLAAMLGVTDENVRCIYIDGAGCYGRNAHEDAAGDAALLARAVGQPVRVQWMRADEHGWDPKGPPTMLDMRAGLDAGGKILAWESELFIPNGGAGFVALVGADHAGLNSLGQLSPGGVTNDLAIPYTIPNVKTAAHRLESTPFKPSWIRSPGRMQNTFANESFFDEVAAASGADPLQLRLQYLHDARGAEVLERLAVLSSWRQRPKPDRQGEIVIGRGLAFVKYELVRTYVGVVAEVQVNTKSGEISAKRFYVAHDCGQIINPDGLRNQIEGNVVQTVSRVLKEEVSFDRSMVTSLDWGTYPILTFPEVPEVTIDLIDRPNEVPWGAGEPSAAVVPAAVANAVFDAIGVRLRSVPFTPAKVKLAMGTS
jgi:CO/xanthine dehydrogenase Mo-binding subunit